MERQCDFRKKVNDSHDKNVKHFNAKTEVENYECSLLV